MVYNTGEILGIIFILLPILTFIVVEAINIIGIVLDNLNI